MNMETLSVRDYRNNLAASFDMADNGQSVIIKRRNRLYALTCIGQDTSMMTPELQQRIDEARQAYREGNVVSCKTKEELNSFLNSL